jgi:hypothetical protein
LVEVLGILDAPCTLDVLTGEGVQFNLGGDVSLHAFSLPGHMLAELGWFESSTRTLILGDAITGLDWPLFHSHLTVQGCGLHRRDRSDDDPAAGRARLDHARSVVDRRVRAHESRTRCAR